MTGTVLLSKTRLGYRVHYLGCSRYRKHCRLHGFKAWAFGFWGVRRLFCFSGFLSIASLRFQAVKLLGLQGLRTVELRTFGCRATGMLGFRLWVSRAQGTLEGSGRGMLSFRA